MSHFLFLLSSLLLLLHVAAPQSNYADQANSIEYQGNGLPEQATLDGKVTKLDDLSPVIFLNRTKAALNCAAGSMQVELKFNDKFHGIAYADFDRNSACQVYGNGGYSYKLELPLKGCGTKQGPQRVFTNNIVVRFHPGLEIDGDEIITIVCRYPPPVAPLPDPLLDFSKEAPAPAAVLEPALRPFQILLIFCGILFLSLLLLGLGCSYYCLRRRNMTVIRKPFPSVADSEITKLSGSSLGNLSMFEGLKIPRVNAPVLAAVDSSSGSEGLLIPSDYPSESHSEGEDARSLPPSSGGSFENQAYLADNGSYYSEGYGQTQEQHIQNASLPLAVARDQPKFDVQMRVKRAPPSPPSLSISDTESSARTERNLSTIMELKEDSVRSLDSPLHAERTHFTYVPELHAPPKHIQPAPTYNRILRRQQELQDVEAARSIASLNTEMTDTHSMTEMIDDSHLAPAPVLPLVLEPPIVVHRPEITSHLVDDVFLRTITEKKTIEDIERHKRLITEYHTRAKQPEQQWDVTIKNYPLEMAEPPEWENFSDISSASGMTLTPRYEPAPITVPPQNTIDDNKLPLNSPELVGSISQASYLSTFNVPLENPAVPNWNVLIRVLQPEIEDGPVIESAETFNSQLTLSDQMKWRQIITTESTLRTLLAEAIVREDYERIRSDSRYEKLFEPPKWDVIIRILSPIDKPKHRFRKKNDWDTRSRRSSLPTLYEYDSDGGSTLTHEPIVQMMPRRISRSSYRSEADLRSMSEMTVDFGRQEDTHSEASSYYPRYYEEDYHHQHQHHLARSLSQPSLARSASEFTERWIAPSRYDTASEFTSPEATPKSQRSSRIQPLHVARNTGWQPAMTTQVVTTKEFRSEASTSFMAPNRKDWFRDNDSV